MTTGDQDVLKERLLRAIEPHVVFDGWSDTSFAAAVADAGVAPDLARAACPRGALDLAVFFHRQGDRAMLARVEEGTDLSALRYRDRIATLVRFRLEAVADKELVRRAASLFALPAHAAEGARLVWGTADLIWKALGDSSQDINWYTKRATLSAVYSATVLYWLGDETPDNSATWAFLERRIEDVMQIEKLKARLRENPLSKRLLAGPMWAAGKLRAPAGTRAQDLPGHWDEGENTNDDRA